MVGRIVFEGSPWPNGHAIARYEWTARVEADGLFFDFELESEKYDAITNGVDPSESRGDWRHPGVWLNYHSCHLRPEGGFKVADDDAPLDFLRLEGRTFRVDVDAAVEPAFSIYLLGHNDVSHHEITFNTRHESGAFAIDWRGQVEVDGVPRPFHAVVESAALRKVSVPAWEGEEKMARGALDSVCKGMSFVFQDGAFFAASPSASGIDANWVPPQTPPSPRRSMPGSTEDDARAALLVAGRTFGDYALCGGTPIYAANGRAQMLRLGNAKLERACAKLLRKNGAAVVGHTKRDAWAAAKIPKP